MFSLRNAATRSASRTFSTSARRQDFAKLTLIGRLGTTPEVKTSKSDNEYVTYAVATNTYTPGKDGEKPTQKTTWHRILSFSESNNKWLQTLQKGSKVYVEAAYELKEPDPEADPSTPNGQRQIFLRHETLRIISKPPKPAETSSESSYRLD